MKRRDAWGTLRSQGVKGAKRRGQKAEDGRMRKALGTKPRNLNFTPKATERVKCTQTGILETSAEGKIDREEGSRGRGTI